MKAGLIWFFPLLLVSCNTYNFPDSINSKLTSEHFRIKGTKLYVKNIEGFTYFDNGVFRHSDSVYIGYYYTPASFLQLNNHGIDYYTNKNPEIIFTKHFSINGYPGIFSKLKENNSYWLYFIFGDSLVENRIVATYPVSESYEKKIFEFVKNVYYDPAFSLNPLEGAHFEIDTSNIGFHFVNYLMMQYSFMEDDYKKYETGHINLISILQQPPLKDSTVINKVAATMIQSMRNNKQIISIEVLEKNNILINSCYATRILLKERIGDMSDSWDATIYTVVAGNENGGIVFTGVMYHNVEKLIPLFDRIVNTLKIKKVQNLPLSNDDTSHS